MMKRKKRNRKGIGAYIRYVLCLRVPSEQMHRRVPRPRRPPSTYPRVDLPRGRLGVRFFFVKRNKKKNYRVYKTIFITFIPTHNDATYTEKPITFRLESLPGGFVVFRRAFLCAYHARSGQPNA